MDYEAILKPIGNGQITIPYSWRKLLGIDKKYVKASIENGKVIIEPLDKEVVDWDVDSIKFEDLNNETKDTINKSRKNYKDGDKDEFLSHNEMWGDV